MLSRTNIGMLYGVEKGRLCVLCKVVVMFVMFWVKSCGCVRCGKVRVNTNLECTSQIDVVERPERDHCTVAP